MVHHMTDTTPRFKIKGTRINLRTTIQSDIADYRRWDDPDLAAWRYDGPYYERDLGKFITGRQKWLAGNQASPYSFLEIETSDGVHLGWVVFYFASGLASMPEFGINIVEDEYWNRGLGTEAVSLWIDYLFGGYRLHRLGFSTWSGNKRMIAVGTRLGFVEEARIRQGCRVEGKYYDRIKMGLLREEWESRRQEGP